VVTRSIPGGSVAVGNPCRVIKRGYNKRFIFFRSKCRDYAFLKEIKNLKKIIYNREKQISDLKLALQKGKLSFPEFLIKRFKKLLSPLLKNK